MASKQSVTRMALKNKMRVMRKAREVDRQVERQVEHPRKTLKRHTKVHEVQRCEECGMWFSSKKGV